MRLRCPECGGRAGTRTSRAVTTTIAEAYFDCANPECGCRFKVIAEIVGVKFHGDVPNTMVALPVLKTKLQSSEV